MKIFIIVGVLLLANSAMAAPNDVLAKVNGQDITKGEIDNELKMLTNGQAAAPQSYDKLPPDVQKAFVDKYIDKRLIIDAAKKEGLENDPQILQKLAEAKDFLIQQKYLNDLVSKEKLDDSLKKTYDEKVKNLQGKEEVHAEQIIVKTEDDAKKLKSQLEKGANFEDLAKASSIEAGAKVSNGDLGYFAMEEMPPEISKAAFALKKGEVSQPVQTGLGWHIIKVLDRRPVKIPSFAESKPALERVAETQIIEDKVKNLKSQATVEYFGSLAAVPSSPAVKPEVKKIDSTTK